MKKRVHQVVYLKITMGIFRCLLRKEILCVLYHTMGHVQSSGGEFPKELGGALGSLVVHSPL